jgi:hypothetical protein
MPSDDNGPRRTFTVVEANTALPLVRAIVADLVRLAHEVSDRAERLSLLLGSRRSLDRGDPYADEMAHMVGELQRDRERLQEYVDELLAFGVEPRSAIEGLVHFPTIMDGRVVHLCWKLGEPEVLFWHEVDANFVDRRLLSRDATSVAELVSVGRDT